MKIYSYNYQLLLDLIKDRALSGNKADNLSAGLPETPAEVNEADEVIKLLEQLESSLRKKLLKTFFKYNLPLKREYLLEVISLINNTNLADRSGSGGYQNYEARNNHGDLQSSGGLENPGGQRAFNIMKAFIFLLKNNLPLLRGLIEGIASNLDARQSLSEKINSKPDLLPGITDKLAIRPNLTPQELQDELRNYPAQLNRAIRFLNQTGDETSAKILNQLLGQQLINNQDSNTLLTLELPLFFPQYSKLVPAYLHVLRERKTGWESKEKKEGKKAGDTFKISFLISLEKRGTIRADITYTRGRIGGVFKSSSPETRRLIRENIPGLQERLEKLGFRVEKPLIEPLEEQGKAEKFLAQLLPPDEEEKGPDEPVHFDLRV